MTVAQQPPSVKPPAPALTGCDAVRQEVSKYSGWDVDIITAIARAESSCRVDATGDTSLVYTQNNRQYGYSVSVLQVRIMAGREHCDKHDLATNVRCAYAIWQGQGYAAWTMYNNNKYLAFL